MRSLLVPVDGSENSLRAVDYASSQGDHAPIVLHLLNVEPPLDDYGMVGVHLPPKKHEKLMRERANAILKRAEGRVHAKQVECRRHVAIGEVAPTIASTAQRLKCDSIVMGTRGMGSLANLVLGSVASKVVHLSKVPVTLVPRNRNR